MVFQHPQHLPIRPFVAKTHELGECRFGLGHAGLGSEWVATKTLELIDENMGTGKVALAEIRALRLKPRLKWMESELCDSLLEKYPTDYQYHCRQQG